MKRIFASSMMSSICFVSNKGFEGRRGAPCEERKGPRAWGDSGAKEARMSRTPPPGGPWGLPTYF